MAGPYADEDEEKPLDPAVENVRRKLLRFMAINLGLLFGALMIVVAALVYKSWTAAPQTPPVTTLAPPAEGGLVEGTIPLPAGARIVSQSLSGDRVSLHVEEAGGATAFYIYDLAAGRMVGRFALGAPN